MKVPRLLQGSILCASSLFLAACSSPAGVGFSKISLSQQDSRLLTAMLVAEDQRADSPAGMAPLLEGLQSANADIRRIGVRALGRLERASLVTSIAPMLADPAASVRREAANALGQAVTGGDPEMASSVLIPRLADEQDPMVRGMIVRTLGRLPYDSPEQVRAAESALLAASGAAGAAAAAPDSLSAISPPVAPLDTLLGIARGFESLARLQAKEHPLMAPSMALLRALARYGMPHQDPPRAPTADRRQDRSMKAARIRRLATSGLIASGHVDSRFLRQALDDPDQQVRRLAAAAAGTLDLLDDRRSIVEQALADPSAAVRYEALRAYGRRLQADGGCAPTIGALDDPGPHVALLAIDLLARGCASAEVSDRLTAIATRLVAGGGAAVGGGDVG
ncbi:MAG: HEAT repeat domain-containing protein, partial [Acidobacteriota bacterium]